MMNLNQKKLLSITVSALMTFTTCYSVSGYASDIEIYKSGFTPKPVVMFALDNSGSMSGRRSAFDLKDSMQAVLLGDGDTIKPARNIRAGLSTFESPPWYPIKNGVTTLYYTAVHPATSSAASDSLITAPRRDAGYIARPAQLLDDKVVYPSSRKDLFPANGDVIFKSGNNQPVVSGGASTINTDDKKVYIRFQVDVPRGATINSAYLELRSNTDNGANKLKVRVARHDNLYMSNPTVTRLQSYTGADTSKTIQSGVDNNYLTTIFSNATTQRAIDAYRNSYANDNVSNPNPMYVYSMDIKSEMEALIKNNNNWCGMGDIIFELSRDSSKNYTFYSDREDRVNPHLYIDWTLDDNTKRADNCMFTDTKRSSGQRITNLGSVGSVSTMTARQAMNLQVQRIITDTATPSAQLYAETIAYMLGNSTKPLTNTNPANTSIDVAQTGLTTGTGNTIKYLSPIDSIRNYVSNPTNETYASVYRKEQECGQHGIYFLTDGEANAPTPNDKLFASSMGLSSISCNSFDSCAQFMAKGLLKTTGSPFSNREVKIKTYTVGFNYTGSALSNWAAAGGGQYTSVSSSDSGGAKAGVISSINRFLDDIFDTHIPPVLTGSPTLPQDALNPLRIQPYAYYASFTPKPQESTQLWAGNMNKYHVLNGQLYAANKSTQLFNTDGSLNQSADGIWTGGVKGQLPLGIQLNTDNIQVASRTIYTNREITGSAPYTASEIDSLKKVNLQNVFAIDPSGTALFANDPAKNYWLNLLGYNVTADETVALSDLVNKAELRQVGSVMHSTPVLLTQEGKITTTSGQLNTTDRKDYLLFGTTQGLLHVVDATTGKEIFAFVPNEMMQNQPKAFLSESSSSGGSSNLYYGIDAPWTAHTQYVAKADGTLTVNDSGRTVTDSTSGDEIALKGLQWVYGGLRMGGRSYYALDLSDLTNPKLKFHINPDGAINADKTPNTDNALSYMGQSWSKPTIAYVNFGGKKKLVMFVGGGYDAGYENPAYDQTNNKGAGVYMFDANNGDLLWWSSANASADKGAQAHTEDSDLKYSVVSQINAVDRDSDGLVDHLYFGDLGGQAFRIDLNNNATGDNAAAKKGNFVTHVVRLLNQHVNNDGTSPRFYEMPSFSVSKDDSGSLVGVVALSSGNRSSPLAGAIGTNNATASTSANDGVFVVFDKDVAKTNLYSLVDTDLTTKNIATLRNLNTYFTASFAGDIYKNGVSVVANDGWKYTYSDSAGVYKGMNGLYALDGMLYVNVFYRDGDGIGGSCGAGVKGNSKLYQFCLPTGKCSFYGSSTTQPNNTDLGAGILGTALGNATSNNGQTLLQNVVKKTDNFCTDANKNSPECQLFNTTAKLQNLRWYETR
ncbi:PilC/PilY family type IV pilus protein [Acinetobacter baumannii]|uniref:PilC/PilY family type IV pilus protein n=1 Tax=Acinetobacter baumannii TaxID=470 RepID=UPI001D0EE81D|nr:PilC/PilY family type IV pilus protein [Acinetobacter baumannii]